jgi:DNA-binding CsgD family transcriptional regulator
MTFNRQLPKFFVSLSEREIRVAQYYSLGKSYKQIAQELKVSPATIRNQIASVYRKLEIKNKAELVIRLTRDIDDGLFASTFDSDSPIASKRQETGACSYACSDYPGFHYCSGKVQAKTESELWQLIKVHAIVAHEEVPAKWTYEERKQIKALIKTVD